MTATYSKVKSIADDLGLSESKVTMVLYDYLTYCLQEALLDGKTHTIFGNLTLNNDDRFVLENDKFGLISLLGKKDLKLLRKIAEDGPDSSVFQI